MFLTRSTPLIFSQLVGSSWSRSNGAVRDNGVPEAWKMWNEVSVEKDYARISEECDAGIYSEQMHRSTCICSEAHGKQRLLSEVLRMSLEGKPLPVLCSSHVPRY